MPRPLIWSQQRSVLRAVDAARTLDIDLSIKWPNDLLESGPQGRKVAGMLSEIVYPEVGGDHIGVVAGIGINVSWPTPDDVASIAEVASATCLDQLAPHPVDRQRWSSTSSATSIRS